MFFAYLCFLVGFFAPWCFVISAVFFIANFFEEQAKIFKNETPLEEPGLQKPILNEISFKDNRIFIKLPLEWFEVVKELQQYTDPDEDLVFLGYKIEDGRLILEFKKRDEVVIKEVKIDKEGERYRVNIVYENRDEDDKDESHRKLPA